MSDVNGWDKLLCNYFYLICTRVLVPYFSFLGFVENKTKIGGAFFKKGDLFVEISYIPENAPNYSPSIIVGIGSDKYDNLGQTTGIPAWRVLPEDGEARKYSFWKFSNEIELENVLKKIEAEILEKHMRPLWEDRLALEKVAKNFGSDPFPS